MGEGLLQLSGEDEFRTRGVEEVDRTSERAREDKSDGGARGKVKGDGEGGGGTRDLFLFERK